MCVCARDDINNNFVLIERAQRGMEMVNRKVRLGVTKLVRMKAEKNDRQYIYIYILYHVAIYLYYMCACVCARWVKLQKYRLLYTHQDAAVCGVHI